MSVYDSDTKLKTLRRSFANLLFLFPFTIAFLGIAFALSVERQMKLERTGPHTFRVTGSNHLLGLQFYSKTIEGVERYRLADSSRSDRRDSIEERNRRSKRQRLAFTGKDGSELSWQRTEDSGALDSFTQSNEPAPMLVGTPPRGCQILAWLSLGMAGLVFIGPIQNCFFVQKSGLP